MTSFELIWLLALGLAAGVFGGLLGIGGSIIIIPGLTLVLGTNQHVSQAAAMIVNAFVAWPAFVSHMRAKAVRWDVLVFLVPAGLVLILFGVEASNYLRSDVLERIFGVFLVYVLAVNVYQLAARHPEPIEASARRAWPLSLGTGALTGFIAGMVGIGGGIVSVPLLQRLVRIPLRQCIATSAAFMCISAPIGALRKNLTLTSVADSAHPSVNLHWHDSVTLAMVLAMTAMIGGLFGGRLTHRLPLFWVRVAFVFLLTWASANMLGII